MQSQIHNLVITSIRRDDNNVAQATTRLEENNVSNLSEAITTKLTNIFSTTGLRLGRFDTDTGYQHFASTLSRHLNNADLRINNFLSFATNVGSSLASKLNEGRAQNAKAGFLLTYCYTVTQENEDDTSSDTYLGLIFLHRINGVDIDTTDLNLKDIEQINLDSLNLGARINLSRFSDEQDDEAAKSIAFKIGRGSEVRVYFQDFIGCSEPTNAKVDSQNLINALEHACGTFGLDDAQKQSALEYAESYCSMILNHGNNEMSLLEFANHVFSNNDEHVEQFIHLAQNTFELSESIGLDPSEVKKFGTVVISNNHYRVKLNKAAFLEDMAVWDSENQTLTLFGLSQADIEKLNLVG
ncbi:hypothetical protein A1OK_10810 [Enterovibrio norvegicus FF-454]|uniref:Nucleoid-associated protein NdpA n=1 Tax=Enterovibrio norvegicus FF-454 TaxID=1185651 RepID=A0A1E5C4M4_9GAMM|nr:nucleoid-associated protein [Enterovibrio norvegicus]OEE60433.1 hypothetical protein A1OK_10810 [Enterovibrio norvegicus FF-454]